MIIESIRLKNRLLESLIKLTTQEGQIVLDPFCGSGSTLVAAKKLKRNYIGIEFSEEFCNIARERLENEISEIMDEN